MERKTLDFEKIVEENFLSLRKEIMAFGIGMNSLPADAGCPEEPASSRILTALITGEDCPEAGGWASG